MIEDLALDRGIHIQEKQIEDVDLRAFTISICSFSVRDVGVVVIYRVGK